MADPSRHAQLDPVELGLLCALQHNCTGMLYIKTKAYIELKRKSVTTENVESDAFF
jgi:hypothetical protein